jgi:uncharacterized protein (DUF2126 family)
VSGPAAIHNETVAAAFLANQSAKDTVVQVFAETRLQRLSFDQFECSGSAGLSFGSQEQDVSLVLLIEAMRQFIKMRHANNLDPIIQ